MSRKTKKLMWSVPIVAVLAIVGALVMFAAQGPGSVFANPLPAAPSTLEAEAASGDAGRTTLVLSWTAPVGGNVSGYRIDMAESPGAVWETLVSADNPHTSTTYTDSNLTSDDTRWYRVFAVNDHGVGPVSNAASGTTDKKVNPGSVMNLRAVPNAKKPYNRIDLSWDAPAADGGEKIVGYEVQYHNGEQWGNVLDATFTVDNVTRTDKTSIMDPAEMDPGDTRRYRVRAINGPGDIEDASSVAVTTEEEATPSRSKEWARADGTTQAAKAPGRVTGLTVVNATDASINLYWYDPADTGGFDITGYLIQVRQAGKKFKSIPKDDDLSIPDTINEETLGSGREY